jgi:hypothetical protein
MRAACYKEIRWVDGCLDEGPIGSISQEFQVPKVTQDL